MMVQMMDRRRLPNMGDASVFEVDLTDGETIKIIVSNAAKAVMGGEEPAFLDQLAKTLVGRNSSVPTRSSRSFV
jgi:hypothetical protein